MIHRIVKRDGKYHLQRRTWWRQWVPTAYESVAFGVWLPKKFDTAEQAVIALERMYKPEADTVVVAVIEGNVKRWRAGMMSKKPQPPPGRIVKEAWRP